MTCAPTEVNRKALRKAKKKQYKKMKRMKKQKGYPWLEKPRVLRVIQKLLYKGVQCKVDISFQELIDQPITYVRRNKHIAMEVAEKIPNMDIIQTTTILLVDGQKLLVYFLSNAPPVPNDT
jgi:hypothetical protein